VRRAIQAVALAAMVWRGVGRAQVVQEYLTLPDRSALVAEQKALVISRGTAEDGVPSIEVDATKRFQTVDGFGFALTGGTAELMMGMPAEKRLALLKELFGKDGIGVSYVRLSIGASDMNAFVYSYDDLPEGQEDRGLEKFSLGEDLKYVVPVMQEVERIRPGIAVLGSPWSAPAWMKTNGKVKGGELKPELYGVYAEYFVRYLEAMRAKGVVVGAITMQNEPLNPKNTPSLVMSAEQQTVFLRDDLGPALRKAGLKTKVVLYDHNCDKPGYAETVLSDAKAAAFADGSGFHLYGGKVAAMSEVHDRFPRKNLYFTEQMIVDAKGATELKIAAPVSRVVIGAMRNWSRNVLLWNLAADASFGPHTKDGGCPVCEGAVTIDGEVVTRNLAYWTLAQVSEFVRPGDVRVGSSEVEGLSDVAFVRRDGKRVLVVANTSDVAKKFVVKDGGRGFVAELAAGAAGTFVW